MRYGDVCGMKVSITNALFLTIALCFAFAWWAERLRVNNELKLLEMARFAHSDMRHPGLRLWPVTNSPTELLRVAIVTDDMLDVDTATIRDLIRISTLYADATNTDRKLIKNFAIEIAPILLSNANSEKFASACDSITMSDVERDSLERLVQDVRGLSDNQSLR